MMQKNFIAKTLNPAEALDKLQKRIDMLKQEKIGSEKELSLLKKQYAEKLAELNELGIEDVSDLPVKIEELQIQLQERQSQVEFQVSELEAKLRG